MVPVPFLLAWGAVLLVATIVSLAAAPAVADEAAHYNPSACQKSSFRCSDTVDVRYPFFLANATYAVVEGYTAYTRSYCGYPGMAIACEGGRATLKLKSDNYTVLDIDYDKHTVTVADADVLVASGGDDCPRVAHNVTVPAETWLNLSVTANDNLVFFYDCVFTEGITPPPPAILPPINCSSFRSPSGAKSFVVVQPDMRLQDEWPRECRAPVVAPVLKRLLGPDEDYFLRLNSDGYGQLLKQGFQLTWDPSAGSCYFCEKSNGQCSYNQVGELIGCLCSDGRVRSLDCGSKNNKKAIAIGTSIAAGVLSLLLVVITCLYIRKRRQYKMTSSSRLLKPTASGGTPRSRGSTTDMESGSVHS
ncbi:LEAF RUST 10 DISEASE-RESISTANCEUS RECEPTOR-LIKE PROTEIN KINASE-like 2.7, partial [Miscanthus floridulus]|uniref:LEAF RUST 10 DISEASE-RESISTANCEUS RECEPTOR-LIKE PROTEIN KINASE-like 2.7 n=1 Tax=Miscanthus floridulus TaxID=154761 RepID=UPI00345AAB96